MRVNSIQLPVIGALLASLCAATLMMACSAGGDATNAPPGVTGPGPGPITPVPARLPACGQATALMTVPPVPLADLLGWLPLGNMRPPGHLFPVDHQYLYINNPEDRTSWRQVTLFAPAAITITQARRTHYSASDTYDYSVQFGICDEVYGSFGHVTTLTPSLLEALGAFDQFCESNSLGTNILASCSTKIFQAIPRAAGDTLGTTGGQGTSFALDFSLRDRRVTPLAFANQSRWTSQWADLVYTVAPTDYYAEPARSAIRAKIGNYNGTIRRTAEPLGGGIAFDLPGTMRGVWVNTARPLFPDGSHLVFAPDNIDPLVMVLSMGTSQPGFPAGRYSFSPRTSGFVNRDPAQVTTDSSIYCFEFGFSLGLVLARLEGASSLRMEGRPGVTTCAEQEPWTFGEQSFVYAR